MSELCAHCQGTGRILIDDITMKECVCAFAKAVRTHLGDIALASVLDESPFFTMDEEGGTDLTLQNLLIKSYWEDLVPHLKLVLIRKGLRFKFLVTTDQRILGVYLGKESYAARSKNKRDEVEVYNGLGDLLGADQDLVIVRLGVQSYKNQALPGILKEALLLRGITRKAIWLLEEPDNKFGPGHIAYNEDVAEYIRKHFSVVSIQGDDRHLTDRYVADESPGLSVDEPEAKVERAQESAFDVATSAVFAAETPSKSKYKPKPKFKSKSSKQAQGMSLSDIDKAFEESK
jgi:hypothetical protein